jgi:hypothetical protein
LRTKLDVSKFPTKGNVLAPIEKDGSSSGWLP